MQVWQHLDHMDHLRRRAEGMIDAARGPQSASVASHGYVRTSTQDAQKFGILDAVQGTPGLLDFDVDSSN